MIASLILVACAQESFQVVTIQPPAGLDTTTTVVLLDDGTIAASWREVGMKGVHGEVPFAKPFVWDGKAHVALPVLKSGWGTVIHGRNGVLVGFVMDDYSERPCMWVPDARDGWKRPSLKVLDTTQGWATWVDTSGKVWISDSADVSCWSDGKLTRTEIGGFDLVGTAKDGRRFGNKYGGFGEGMTRLNQVPGFFEGGKWKQLAENGEINAVNDGGVAVGRLGGSAVVWREGSQTILTLPGSEFSEALAVSSDGAVVWSARLPSETQALLWRNGESVNISRYGLAGFADVAMNGKGQILSGGPRLTLLTPNTG